MKKLVLILSLLVSVTAFANYDITGTFLGAKEVEILFNGMKEVASNDGYFIYFGATRGEEFNKEGKCVASSKEDLLTYIRSTSKMLRADLVPLYERALPIMDLILTDTKYTKCVVEEYAPYTFTEYTHFVSEESGLNILFELGFDD